MPKIPRLNESVQMQATSSPLTSESSTKGQGLQALGQGAANLASGLTAFMKKEKAESHAAEARMWGNKAEEVGWEALKQVSDIESEKMIPTFDEKFKSLYEQAENIEDEVLRQRVLNNIDNARLGFRGKLTGQVIQGIAAEKENRTQSLVNGYSQNVFQNPDDYQKYNLEFQDYMFDDANYNDVDKARIMRQTKKDFLRSAVNGLKSQGRYEDAKNFLKGESTTILTTDEFEAELEEIDQEMFAQSDREYKEEVRKRAELKVKREQEMEQIEQTVFSLWDEADTIEARAAVLETAKEYVKSGDLKASVYRNFFTDTNAVNTQQSEDTHFEYDMKIFTGNASTLKDIREEIENDVNVRLRPQEGRELLNRLRQNLKRNKSSNTVVARNRRQLAKDLLSEAVTPDGKDAFNNLFYEDVEKRATVRNIREVQLKYLEQGLTEDTAMRKAIQDVLKTKPLNPIPGIPFSQQQDPQQLQDRASTILKNYDKLPPEKRTPEVESYINDILKKVDENYQILEKRKSSEELVIPNRMGE